MVKFSLDINNPLPKINTSINEIFDKFKFHDDIIQLLSIIELLRKRLWIVSKFDGINY